MTVPTLAVNNFALRQTPESPFSHFAGTWDELLDLVRDNWDRGKAGPREGVVLIPIPNDGRFFSAVTPLTLDTLLTAKFAARRPGEDPFITVNALGPKAPGKLAVAVMYQHGVLEPKDRSSDADYELVSLNVLLTEEPEPMHPVAMARNFLGLAGGSKSVYSAEEFAKAIVYWASHAMASGEEVPEVDKLRLRVKDLTEALDRNNGGP